MAERRLRVAEPSESTEALAHLLACLDRGVKLLEECGFDVDSQVVEAHRAELVRGREWPGDPITPPVFEDERRRESEESDKRRAHGELPGAS